MEDKRVYLLAQFDEPTNQKLADIYDKLVRAGMTGEQTQGIPYHFTLGSFAVGCESEVLARAQALCGNTKAFDIQLAHVGLFGLRVLFLAPAMNMELLKLYSDLVPGGNITIHPWVAHATLLIDDPENIKAALSIVSQSFYSFSARIDSIGVYEFFPQKRIAQYPLLP